MFPIFHTTADSQRRLFFPAKLLESPHEPVFVNFYLKCGSDDVSEQILAAMENLEHICYEVHLLTRKSFKLITEQEASIAGLQEELEQRKLEHKRKFQELLKESQKRIELIQGDSRYLRRENDELRLENELLRDQVAAFEANREAILDSQVETQQFLGVSRFELQRKSLPDRPEKIPLIVKPTTTAISPRPPTSKSFLNRISPTCEQNIKPSDLRERNWELLVRRKSLQEPGIQKIRKRRERKTEEVTADPSQIIEGINEIGASDNSRASTPTNSLRSTTPHEWVRHKSSRVPNQQVKTARVRRNSSEGSTRSGSLRRRSSISKGPKGLMLDKLSSGLNSFPEWYRTYYKRNFHDSNTDSNYEDIEDPYKSPK